MLRRFAFLLATLSLGCSLTPSPAPAPGTPTGASFATLVFAKPSLDTIQAFTYLPRLVTSAPDFAQRSGAFSRYLPDAQSGDVDAWPSYSFDTLRDHEDMVLERGGIRERRALAGFEEATAAGFTGDFVTLRRTLVDPLVAGWASDAVLVRANVSAEELGGGSAPPSPICYGPLYGPPWDLVFVSEARTEVLRLFVDGARLRVVRLRWEPLDPPPPPPMPAVDREAAIARLTAALRTPGSLGDETRSRLEYFHRSPWAEPSYSPGEVAVEGTPGPLYDVPEATAWSAEYQRILGRRVWILSAAQAVAPSPSPTAGYKLLCSGPPTTPHLTTVPQAWGMVDADTGTVIRFLRPARVTTRTPAP